MLAETAIVSGVSPKNSATRVRCRDRSSADTGAWCGLLPMTHGGERIANVVKGLLHGFFFSSPRNSIATGRRSERGPPANGPADTGERGERRATRQERPSRQRPEQRDT